MGNRPFIVEDFKRALYPQLVMTTSWHRLSGLVVVDFRFLAALGMTGRREPVIAATPFPCHCQPAPRTHRGAGKDLTTLLLLLLG